MPTIYQSDQRVDHYEIIRLLGQGGASHVYLARDRRSQQRAMMKEQAPCVAEKRFALL